MSNFLIYNQLFPNQIPPGPDSAHFNEVSTLQKDLFAGYIDPGMNKSFVLVNISKLNLVSSQGNNEIPLMLMIKDWVPLGRELQLNFTCNLLHYNRDGKPCPIFECSLIFWFWRRMTTLTPLPTLTSSLDYSTSLHRNFSGIWEGPESIIHCDKLSDMHIESSITDMLTKMANSVDHFPVDEVMIIGNLSWY